MSHTKEPWRVSGTGHLCAGDKVIPYDDLKADARRIVACVNACAELPTEDLDRFGLGLIEKLREDEAFSLIKQRDELLAALKGLIEGGDNCVTDRDEVSAILRFADANKAARAAIAKAEAKQ